jgi:hypothetical protein
MISDLDVLAFDELRAQHPDRYEKADLAAASVKDDGLGCWIVQRGPSDKSHVVELVETAGHPVGSCSCEGYSFHELPCSHLAAVWRMELADLLDIPRARLRSADVEVPGEDQELSTAVDRATGTEPLPDGGERR